MVPLRREAIPWRPRRGVRESRGRLPSVRTEQDEKPWVLGLLVEVGDEDRCREKGLRRGLARAARGGREGDQRGGARRPAAPPEDACEGTRQRLASTAHPRNPSHPEGLRTQHRAGGGGAGPGRSQAFRASSPLPARLPGCPALAFLRLSQPPSPPGGSRFPRPPWSPASTLERHCPGTSGLKEPEKPES